MRFGRWGSRPRAGWGESQATGEHECDGEQLQSGSDFTHVHPPIESAGPKDHWMSVPRDAGYWFPVYHHRCALHI